MRGGMNGCGIPSGYDFSQSKSIPSAQGGHKGDFGLILAILRYNSRRSVYRPSEKSVNLKMMSNHVGELKSGCYLETYPKDSAIRLREPFQIRHRA